MADAERKPGYPERVPALLASENVPEICPFLISVIVSGVPKKSGNGADSR